MIQVIKRKEGAESIKETIQGRNVQIAYNDYGHITVRVINDSTQDTLIVFNTHVSYNMINFIKDRVKEPIGHNFNDSDLPF